VGVEAVRAVADGALGHTLREREREREATRAIRESTGCPPVGHGR
jgi:hypothetical protein